MIVSNNRNKGRYIVYRNRNKKYSLPYKRFTAILNKYLSGCFFGKYYWRERVGGHGYQSVGNNDYQQDYGFHIRVKNVSATVVADGHGYIYEKDDSFRPNVGMDFCEWLRPQLLRKINEWVKTIGLLPNCLEVQKWWKELDWLELYGDYDYYVNCGTTVSIALCDHNIGNVISLQLGDSEIFFGNYKVDNNHKIRNCKKELIQKFDLKITGGKRINDGPNTLGIGDWFYYGSKEKSIDVIINMTCIREFLVRHKTPIICMTDGIYDWIKYMSVLTKYPINKIWDGIIHGDKPQEIARNIVEGTIYLGLCFGRNWCKISDDYGPKADNMTAIVGIV